MNQATMKAPYYTPSGKYHPRALVRLAGVVFAISLITEFLFDVFIIKSLAIFKYVSCMFAIAYIFFAFYINAKITCASIKIFKIRNPRLAVRLIFVSSGLAAVLITLFLIVIFYIKQSTELNFGNYIASIAFNGIDLHVGLKYRDHFYLNICGHSLLVCLAMKIFIYSFLLGHVAACQANLPFSETRDSWHKRLRLPIPVEYPPKKDVHGRLQKGDISSLLLCRPSKYGNPGWGGICLFIPENDDIDYYISLAGGIEAQYMDIGFFRGGERDYKWRKFWLIDRDKAENIAYMWGQKLPLYNVPINPLVR